MSAQKTAGAADAQAQTNPRTLGGVVPYLTVDGASRAAEFYQRAFGAEEVARHPEDDQGRTMHIHLHINGGSLMLGDAYPEHGHALQTPQAFNLLLPVEEVDACWNRAVEAGAEVIVPLQVMFWGDRYGELRDPFGVRWSIDGPTNGVRR
jgi:PhnB protein